MGCPHCSLPSDFEDFGPVPAHCDRSLPGTQLGGKLAPKVGSS